MNEDQYRILRLLGRKRGVYLSFDLIAAELGWYGEKAYDIFQLLESSHGQGT